MISPSVGFKKNPNSVTHWSKCIEIWVTWGPSRANMTSVMTSSGNKEVVPLLTEVIWFTLSRNKSNVFSLKTESALLSSQGYSTTPNPSHKEMGQPFSSRDRIQRTLSLQPNRQELGGSHLCLSVINFLQHCSFPPVPAGSLGASSFELIDRGLISNPNCANKMLAG
jgi:hypothetical protein